MKVCHEVTEIQCEIAPYTDCQMKMELTPYITCEDYPKRFKKLECENGTHPTHHVKMMPECKNVTKQNCVTKWETDDNGEQVHKSIPVLNMC